MKPASVDTHDRTRRERAVLVGTGLEEFADTDSHPSLDELAELAKTAGVRAVARTWQRRTKPDPRYFVGSGKVDEIRMLVREHEADVVLFDEELSPRQVRNLEEEVGCKVLDRSEVILDIFAMHAKTIESRLQVELAQLRYARPRLKRMWTHLSRITGQGGIGSRGPGEKQIETDRRIMDRRILALEREIDEIKARRVRQVSTRTDELTVALVGYTNAGKSTLMTRLTGVDVFRADMLFATLDTKTSDFILENGKRVYLSDTVGFIDKLPHHLVASFNATLEEARQARLLLHIVDASHRDATQQVDTVHRVLEDELEITDYEELIVLNKTDAVEDPVMLSILQERHPGHVAISALTGDGVDLLLKRLLEFDEKSRRNVILDLDAADGRLLSELSRVGDILETDYSSHTGRVRVSVSLPKHAVGPFERYLVEA